MPLRFSIHIAKFSKSCPKKCKFLDIGGWPVRELWVWCLSEDDIAEFIEQILVSGSLVVGLGLLDGRLLIFEEIADVDFGKIGNIYTVLEGVVIAEIVGNIGMIENLLESGTTIRLDLKRYVARITLIRSIRSTKLFDAGLRVLRPRPIPPPPTSRDRVRSRNTRKKLSGGI